MRAARYYGKEDIRIEDVEQQKCGAGQVRVRLANTCKQVVSADALGYRLPRPM